MESDLMLLQYERGKENICRLLPPKVSHEYQQKETRLTHTLEQIHTHLKSEMMAVHGNFTEGASGKSADKIAEGLEDISQDEVYTASSFGF